ncbi:hypothetical protein BXZ70DRAFT_941695 [Cristinia sonorae]|uniref:Uncharacterized protein n=1 Tax=Cristinia sonorae TaxID=1940300 RepID=A0A8K0XP50_9AGAR|nr:hypothetical protein BXZ70DRAFT_941695 [Cristinia sonorae]
MSEPQRTENCARRVFLPTTMSSPLPGSLDSPPPAPSPSILDQRPVPSNLERAAARLRFPPSYVVVGVYRLFTDEHFYKPVWDKCRHGVRRGMTVGVVWVALTFHIQRKFVELFMMKSPRISGLSDSSIFGIPVPFNLPTYAALVLFSSQLTFILTFFLSRNLRIAKDRTWDYTLRSRGKGPEFWKPYVEEWDAPPRVTGDEWSVAWFMTSLPGRWAIKLVLSPLHLVPVFGIMISAYLKAMAMARFLHIPYFKAKGMSRQQVAVFVEERKWSYRTFGFVAAVLEGLPLVGLVFSVSNRIGACMWAYDLEKRQHFASAVRAGDIVERK